MFRFTAIARKIPAFSLFVKEQHAGPSRKLSMKAISRKYQKLTPAQKAALVKRANSFSNPKAGKWSAFVKANKNQYANLSSSARMKKLGEAYRKQNAKAVKPAKRSTARRNVKKTAKTAKAAKAGKKH